jgi:tetratricopeptide (TPR) repeat protein
MRRLPALLVLAATASSLAESLIPTEHDNRGILSVVVLPFSNRSRSELDWVGESLAERISEAVAGQGILVVDRDARLMACQRLSLAPSARLTRGSLIKIAEELDVAVAVSGEYEVFPAPGSTSDSSHASIRLEAFCLDLRHLRMENCGVEQGSLNSLSELQSRLAWQVLRHLHPDSVPALAEFLRDNPPVRLDALEQYVRGLLAETREQKHRFLAQSARLAPDFSAPLFELGRLHFEGKQYRLAAGWLEKVRPASSKYWRAQFLLGLCRYYTGEFTAAESVLARLAEQLPLNEVLNNLAVVRARLNRPDALDGFLQALQGDPDDPDFNFNVGYSLWKRGEFAGAADYLARVLELAPEDDEAALLLKRCQQKQAPRASEAQGIGRERLKLNFDERAWRELIARFRKADH